jgi:hypothetical protein
VDGERTVRFIASLLLAATLAVISGVTTAALVPGQVTWESTLRGRDLTEDGIADAFYDVDLDITWLCNANVAGPMNWTTANEWAESLSVDGIGGWRLPNALRPDGTWCGGYRCTESELGHLWLISLGNLDVSVFNGNSPIRRTGGFESFGLYYWTSAQTSYWQTYFLTSTGYQYEAQSSLELLALAVHDGDIGVATLSEPPLWVLVLTAGLVGFVANGRRKPAQNALSAW